MSIVQYVPHMGMPKSKISSHSLLTVDIMSQRVKETLDAWLKYGTVFLIYRICTYFFFERDNPDAVFFEKDSVQLALLILIGFTVYYLLVQPYIPIHLQHPIVQQVADDTLMFGTVLVTSHVLETYMTEGSYFNKEWLKSAGLILLSFATYRVVVEPFIPFQKINPNIKPIISDWAQFGTFLIAFRIYQGKSVADTKWILSVLFVLLGFTGYHLVTKKIINIE